MLFYTCLGNPSNPPLIFLHGFLGCKEDWVSFFTPLEKNYFSIAFDLPGHGESIQDEEISFEKTAKELLFTLHSLKIEKATFIGYSLGGRVALHLAHYFPHIVHHLIIISAHLGLTSSLDKKERYLTDKGWADLLTQISLEKFLEKWYNQPLFSSLKEKKPLYQKMLERRQKQNTNILSKALIGLSLSHQESFPLTSYKKSLTLIYGEKDKKYEELYTSFFYPHIKVEKVLDSGHAIPIEAPKPLNQLLQKLL